MFHLEAYEIVNYNIMGALGKDSVSYIQEQKESIEHSKYVIQRNKENIVFFKKQIQFQKDSLKVGNNAKWNKKEVAVKIEHLKHEIERCKSTIEFHKNNIETYKRRIQSAKGRQ